jgi:hypothetical protein
MASTSIVTRLRRAVRRFATLDSTVARFDQRLDDLAIAQGTGLARLNESIGSTRLKDHEFKVFSQWGEDGIIQYLTRAIDIAHPTFIEFGVEDFREANCRFLLMKDNWRGFVIDGSEVNISRLRDSYFYWKFQIDAVDAFITRENINDLLARSGFDQDLGILSIDLDGIDYHVLESINTFRPRILICEYNAVFGPSRKISVPYDPGFQRTAHHYSNLYFGASLSALAYLANRKGYTLVGTGSSGGNAFFVRDDLLNERLEPLTPLEAYAPSSVRESRDQQGHLSFVGGDARLELIRGLPVLNVETGMTEPL